MIGIRGRVEPIRDDTVWTGDYESFEEVLTEFLEDTADTEIDSDELSEDDESPTKTLLPKAR